MDCKGCGEEKLLNEYPREQLTDRCKHPYHHCYECVIKGLKKDRKCPKCRTHVEDAQAKIELYDAYLKRLFKHYERAKPTTADEAIIHVRRLDGEERVFPFRPDMTIKELKEKIKAHWKYEVGKQCLKFNKKELEVYDSGRCRTFAEYAVPGGSTIHLIIRLLSVPDNIDHAIFELYWHYPKTSKKNLFIDSSCFVYKGQSLYKVVDFEEETCCSAGIKHSGDDMDRINHIGRHSIEVKLKQLPDEVTGLYFVLSTWNALNLKDNFDHLALKFFDMTDIFTPLCNTELPQDILHRKAVIVCYANRGEGCWHIDEVKIPCDGNVDQYDPMKRAVNNVVKNI